MEIRRIEIAGFGKFSQQVFELSAGLQVIYGDNESGKSTLRAFILGMLFGFPTRRHLIDRYEPKATSQYGGSLDLFVAGQTYRLTRLGDQPAELINVATGDPQPLTLLERWLAPYDENRYKQLFTFNQAELTALKTLSATDLNTQLQQIGTLDSSQWRSTAADLRASADELYKPRGRKPALNQALQQYQTLKQNLQTARDHYATYEHLQVTVQQLQTQQTQLQQQLSQANDAQPKLANLRNQWPVYQQLQQLQTQLSAATTTLPAAVSQQYEQLTTTQTELRHTLASAREQLTQQPVDANSTSLVGFYVAHQTQFDALEPKLPELQQALGQYQALASQTTAAQHAYQQQQTAQPELMAALSPAKQSAVASLKAAVLTTATTGSRQARQSQSAPAFKADWRLIAGGIGLVAGVVLPLGGLKWVLMLVGLGLLGWFGWEQLAPAGPTTADRTLAPLLTAVGWSPDLDSAAILTKLDQLAALQRRQAQVTALSQQTAAQAATVWQALQAYQFASDWLLLDEQRLVVSVQKVTGFYDQVHQAMQHQSLASTDFAYVQRQVKQLTAQLQTTADQLQALATQNGLADVEALADALATQSQRTATQTSVDQLTTRLTPVEQTALQAYPTLSALQAAIQTNRATIQTTQQQLTEQTQQLATAQTQLQALVADGRYADLRQQQADAQTKLTVMARQWVTRQLGATWIETALQQLTSQQLPAILTAAGTTFAQLTGSRYNEIKLNGDTLVVQAVNGPQFSVAELSTATKEQLYLALRLTLITQLGPQAQLPLMIDDGFVNFDTHRRQQAWQLLATVAAKHQILYFTNESAALTEMPAATVHHLT